MLSLLVAKAGGRVDGPQQDQRLRDALKQVSGGQVGLDAALDDEGPDMQQEPAAARENGTSLDRLRELRRKAMYVVQNMSVAIKVVMFWIEILMDAEHGFLAAYRNLFARTRLAEANQRLSAMSQLAEGGDAAAKDAACRARRLALKGIGYVPDGEVLDLLGEHFNGLIGRVQEQEQGAGDCRPCEMISLVRALVLPTVTSPGSDAAGLGAQDACTLRTFIDSVIARRNRQFSCGNNLALMQLFHFQGCAPVTLGIIQRMCGIVSHIDSSGCTSTTRRSIGG